MTGTHQKCERFRTKQTCGLCDNTRIKEWYLIPDPTLSCSAIDCRKWSYYRPEFAPSASARFTDLYKSSAFVLLRSRFSSNKDIHAHKHEHIFETQRRVRRDVYLYIKLHSRACVNIYRAYVHVFSIYVRFLWYYSHNIARVPVRISSAFGKYSPNEFLQVGFDSGTWSVN